MTAVVFVDPYQTEGPICVDDDECCFSGKPHQKTFVELKTGIEMDTCYRNPKLSVLATMFYMVIANVIMLNILIAMFSHRFRFVFACRSCEFLHRFRCVFVFKNLRSFVHRF